MYMESSVLSGISQTETGQYMCFQLHVDSKINRWLSIMRQKETHRSENRLVVTGGTEDEQDKGRG